MKQGKYENGNRRRLPITWILVALLLLSLTVGGVSAYLSISSGASNSFQIANNPVVTVSGTSVTVNPNGVAVYLRVAVDMYWQGADGKILAEEPTGYYSIGGTGWKKIGDFYYYTEKITSTTTVTPVVFDSRTNGSYQLAAKIAAQVVQAVGETDDGTSAVFEAWGVNP